LADHCVVDGFVFWQFSECGDLPIAFDARQNTPFNRYEFVFSQIALPTLWTKYRSPRQHSCGWLPAASRSLPSLPNTHQRALPLGGVADGCALRAERLALGSHMGMLAELAVDMGLHR
jgi:hypothetical protein